MVQVFSRFVGPFPIFPIYVLLKMRPLCLGQIQVEIVFGVAGK